MVVFVSFDRSRDEGAEAVAEVDDASKDGGRGCCQGIPTFRSKTERVRVLPNYC